MPNLQGKKIILRALEQSDIDVLYKWENDTSIWKVSNTVTPYSKFLLEQYLLNSHNDIYTQKQLRLIITDQQKTVVGAIDLFEFDPLHARAGVGILIDKQYRNNGYASDALDVLMDYCFSYLHVNQLYCSVLMDNEASIHLFETKGFEKIGVKKQWLRISSTQFGDVVMMQKMNLRN